MKDLLYYLYDSHSLSHSEAYDILQRISSGELSEAQIASFITVFLMRSITVDELCGFRAALLDMCQRVDLSCDDAIDIVGTGGDEKNTFNISTCASFVVAGAGHKVVKHGNYGSTSISGASNVLEFLGVRFSANEDSLKRSLESSGVSFLHAQLFNPAMKAVAPVRRALGVKTFFNLLGPLVNPAQPKHQLLGVYSLPLQRLYSYTYQSLGVKYSIVNSLDGYDEISLTDSFKVVTNGGESIYAPESLGFERCHQKSLSGGNSVDDAAGILLSVLRGSATVAQTNAVVANAAFAISTLQPAQSIEESIAAAKESIASGRAELALKRFIDINSK